MTPARFRAIREQLGLTQQGMASRLGRHVQTISKWERGDAPVPESPELRLALAALLAGLEPVDG